MVGGTHLQPDSHLLELAGLQQMRWQSLVLRQLAVEVQYQLQATAEACQHRHSKPRATRLLRTVCEGRDMLRRSTDSNFI